MIHTPRRARVLLIHGLLMVMVGLVWGLAIPHTPFPRLALGAHIQFVTGGVLLIVMAILLLTLPHNVGPRSIAVMLLSAWLTWLMALSEIGNSFWGTTHMLPIAAAQAGARGGTPWQEQLVAIAHIAAALSLLAAWGLLILGFVRGAKTE
jgi:(hydroxyamino)benzene mutase